MFEIWAFFLLSPVNKWWRRFFKIPREMCLCLSQFSILKWTNIFISNDWMKALLFLPPSEHCRLLSSTSIWLRKRAQQRSEKLQHFFMSNPQLFKVNSKCWWIRNFSSWVLTFFLVFLAFTLREFLHVKSKENV